MQMALRAGFTVVLYIMSHARVSAVFTPNKRSPVESAEHVPHPYAIHSTVAELFILLALPMSFPYSEPTMTWKHLPGGRTFQVRRPLHLTSRLITVADCSAHLAYQCADIWHQNNNIYHSLNLLNPLIQNLQLLVLPYR